MADSPQALVIVYNFFVANDLKETPYRSAVSRMKGILQKKGLQDFKKNGWAGYYGKLDSKDRERKSTEVNTFWGSPSDCERYPALSEAGWRYFLRLSLPAQRALTVKPWRWKYHQAALNLLGKYDLPAISEKAFDVLEFALPKCVDEDSQHYFARAMATRFARVDDPVTAVEIDCLRDWFYEEARAVNAGTRWETLVAKAFQDAGTKQERAREEMAQYVWSPPIEPFVADDGMTVLPLSNGVQLLEEGQEMGNCLRTHLSYAQRALKGESQVFSIRGVHGRASVEFKRLGNYGPWRKVQVEGPNGEEVVNPVIQSVIEKLEVRMQGGE